MSRTLRECIAGIASGIGMLAMLIIGAMPWWLAALLAMGIYAGLRLCIPVAASPDDTVHAGAITESERQGLLKDSRRHLGSIQEAGRQLTASQPSFASSVKQLEQLTQTILSRLEQAPDAARHVEMLPLYLSKIAANLERYVALTASAAHDAQARQRLSATEEMVQRANVSFEHLRQQLYRDDWMALEAEAEALKSLLDAELP